ncbi:hypothetical protein FHR90_003445 [Endobacter medicaginis]|uniref:Uncharacterized protein n=1 Tax=Endobacter medicaginis TaxID=1181271 RepID=A0A839V466_9PROT|nr:hypothetical protein [Endobacter medicaginis]MBB3175583.1 hypothetical protein [Endobacter medicaginis]MCX5476553.1 hypothetical protein [Endobacter medicaginis]
MIYAERLFRTAAAWLATQPTKHEPAPGLIEYFRAEPGLRVSLRGEVSDRELALEIHIDGRDEPARAWLDAETGELSVDLRVEAVRSMH